MRIITALMISLLFMNCSSTKPSKQVSDIDGLREFAYMMQDSDHYMEPIMFIVLATRHFKNDYTRWPVNEGELNKYIEEKEIGNGHISDLSYIDNIIYLEQSNNSVDVLFDTIFDSVDTGRRKSTWKMNLNENNISSDNLEISIDATRGSNTQAKRKANRLLNDMLNESGDYHSSQKNIKVYLIKSD